MEYYAFSTIGRLASQLSRQGLTSTLLTTYFLNRIEKYNPTLNAFMTVYAQQALSDAAASDRRRQAGQALGLLDGIPIAIVDGFHVADAGGSGCVSADEHVDVGAGAHASADAVVRAVARDHPYAALVRRLQALGAIIIGVTQTAEGTYDSGSTDQSGMLVHNPWDARRTRVSGEVSSGAAVAVAAGLAPCAIGFDRDGSLRLPAAFCSVTGLKLSTVHVPSNDTAICNPMLDGMGPITHTADDAALVLRALAADVAVAPEASELSFAEDGHGLDGLTVCVMPDEQYDIDVQRSVRLGLRDMVRMAEMAGARIIRERPPVSLEQAFEDALLLQEASAWRLYGALAQDDEQPMTALLRNRFVAGQAVSDGQYEDLLGAQKQAMSVWHAWMADKDGFMLPTTPAIAALRTSTEEGARPAFFTRFADWVGASSLALPAGFDPGNMPVSVQLLGKQQDELQLLRIGSAIQSLTAWHSYSPTLRA